MIWMRPAVAVAVLSMAMSHPASATAQNCEPTWDGPIGRPGISGQVHALATAEEAGRPVLYAGGLFGFAGGHRVGNVARWDGEVWTPVGGGLEPGLNGDVRALAIHDDGSGESLYAAGLFSIAGSVDANSIARWDGERWFALGDGIDGEVYALASFDDGSGPLLVAGGSFREAGGVEAASIAAWDGQAWSPLDLGVDGFVYAMAVFDDGSGPALYVGGQFGIASGVPARRIARWDGVAWSAVGGGVGSGVSPWVYSMLVHDDGSGPALFVGGRFASAGSVPAPAVARWDGSDWAALGGGIDDTVWALSSVDDGTGAVLYAGGRFRTAGGLDASNVAQWDGQAWSAVGEDGKLDGTNGIVFALASLDERRGTKLVAGGNFTLAGATSARSVARWGCPTQPCAADCDGDGLVLVYDYLCYLNLFDAGDPRADLDGDGALTVFDFLEFQNDFESGCL